jgi:predicted AAA+ superfamily ATPase
MESLREKFYKRIQSVQLDFVRSEVTSINWNARLIGIKGARGVGKTTLLLQYMKKFLPITEESLYISLDNIWFGKNSLVQLADDFVKEGGKYLFLDEVHKYPNWAQELKNIYDDYPDLKIVFTGSSMLEIINARADLSRRAVVYKLQGLSYRAYLNLHHEIDLPSYSLDDILANHLEIAQDLNNQFKPLQYFKEYLQFGYYPFSNEGKELYYQRIEEVLNLIIEIELPLLRKVDIALSCKIKQLLQIIAESVPFMPNVSKLSERIVINRNTLVSYLFFLEEANIINNQKSSNNLDNSDIDEKISKVAEEKGIDKDILKEIISLTWAEKLLSMRGILKF